MTNPHPDAALARLRVRRSLIAQAPEAVAACARLSLPKRLREFAVFIPLVAAGLLLGSYARHLHSTPLLLLSILLTGVSLNTFPLFVHEGMHRLLLPGRFANWLGSTLFAATFLMSFTAYRVLHTRHHHFLGDPRDPDEYNNYSRSRGMVWCMHFIRLAFGAPLYLVLIPVLALRFGNATERKLIALEYTLLLALNSLLLQQFALRELVLLWILPLLVVSLLTQIRGFAEHGLTDPADPYLASRTMLPHPLVAFFMLNINYHLEHHLFPEIPSYHLPALHRALWPKLPRAVANRSYLAFLGRFLSATPRLDASPIGLIHQPDTQPRA